MKIIFHKEIFQILKSLYSSIPSNDTKLCFLKENILLDIFAVDCYCISLCKTKLRICLLWAFICSKHHKFRVQFVFSELCTKVVVGNSFVSSFLMLNEVLLATNYHVLRCMFIYNKSSKNKSRGISYNKIQSRIWGLCDCVCWRCKSMPFALTQVFFAQGWKYDIIHVFAGCFLTT